MNEHNILEGMGEIDSELVKQAEGHAHIKKNKTHKTTKIQRFLRWGSIAACILLFAGGVVWTIRNLPKDPDGANGWMTGQNDPNEGLATGKPDINEGEGNVQIVSNSKVFTAHFAEDMVEYTPSVKAYQVNADLSNIANNERFMLSEDAQNKLATNKFVVDSTGFDEFYELYEDNRYGHLPNFVTTDSLMHTYHLFFLKLQKETEKKYLYDSVCRLTDDMFQKSIQQYQVLKDSEWGEAAGRNVAFFGVAANLLQINVQVPSELRSVIDEEVAKVMDASAVLPSLITPENPKEGEDYSQYKPRSYYAGDEQLERYFRVMMWYGRTNFAQIYEQRNRCALLINLALTDESCYKEWYGIYEVTSFFTGYADDLSFDDYMPIIRKAYGDDITTQSLIGNDDAWKKFQEEIKFLKAPEINSAVVELTPNNQDANVQEMVKGYRFMGQKYALDAEIFQELLFNSIKQAPDGTKRKLPDALDIPAAMGSEAAKNILIQYGHDKYPNYLEKLEEMRAKVAGTGTYWASSIYAGWLYTLMPLLQEKGEGYPSFMTNLQWQKKDLEGYLGSWTELKHDTVLYSKQPYSVAELGGGNEEPDLPDDRGYVEPEPELYSRLYSLTKTTREGLKQLGYISDTDAESLNHLAQICVTLRDISVKELQNEKITEEEYEFIRSYGGTLEHFWSEARDLSATYEVRDKWTESMDWEMYPEEALIEPSIQIAVDVATNPEGAECLEEALGSVSRVLVVFPIDGELHIAIGGVFTQYQFRAPLSERLTDQEWRKVMGFDPDEDGYYHTEMQEELKQPGWMYDYRGKVIGIEHVEQ